jgi:hypothetical protein
LVHERHDHADALFIALLQHAIERLNTSSKHRARDVAGSAGSSAGAAPTVRKNRATSAGLDDGGDRVVYFERVGETPRAHLIKRRSSST